jgi:hypothetical protein
MLRNTSPISRSYGEREFIEQEAYVHRVVKWWTLVGAIVALPLLAAAALGVNGAHAQLPPCPAWVIANGQVEPDCQDPNQSPYQVIYGTPYVSGVSPNVGTTAGGTSVVITGVGFTGAQMVTFGGVAAPFAIQSDGQVVATAPAHNGGTVDVVVAGPGGASTRSAADQFTYYAYTSSPAVVSSRAQAPFWVNDLAYSAVGGGFYYDPSSGLVWTPTRGWQAFSPLLASNISPLWVDAFGYGPGGGFYLDPMTRLIWTPVSGWHVFSSFGCSPS